MWTRLLLSSGRSSFNAANTHTANTHTVSVFDKHTTCVWPEKESSTCDVPVVCPQWEETDSSLRRAASSQLRSDLSDDLRCLSRPPGSTLTSVLQSTCICNFIIIVCIWWFFVVDLFFIYFLSIHPEEGSLLCCSSWGFFHFSLDPSVLFPLSGGGLLSRVFQTSVSPVMFSSSSGGFPRCSQARWDM